MMTTATQNHRSKPRRRLYNWPENPNEPVVFPYRVYEKTHQEAQTRIINASRMKWQRKKLKWGFRTKCTPDGILFEWQEPQGGPTLN